MLKKRCCLTAGRRAQQRPSFTSQLLAALFSSFSSLLHFLHVEKTLLRSSDSSNSQRILHVEKQLLPDRRQAGAAATPTLFLEFFMLKKRCCLTAGRRAQQRLPHSSKNSSC